MRAARAISDRLSADWDSARPSTMISLSPEFRDESNADYRHGAVRRTQLAKVLINSPLFHRLLAPRSPSMLDGIVGRQKFRRTCAPLVLPNERSRYLCAILFSARTRLVRRTEKFYRRSIVSGTTRLFRINRDPVKGTRRISESFRFAS